MKGLFTQGRLRAAVGLIAAYAIALQTLFAAFAPLPAHAQGGADFGQLSVICFNSGGNTDPTGDDAPAQPSGKFHCILCGALLAGAALAPDPVALPARLPAIRIAYRAAPSELRNADAPARA